MKTEINMKNLVFLKPFTLKNPTLYEQNTFMTRETINEVECADLGEIYSSEVLHGKNLKEFIPETVKAKHPEWIIAENECATVALGLKHQKKILINPKVSYDDLNNVPDFIREHTFGFFDDRRQRDYERFISVYPHAAWYPEDDNLILFTIKEVVEELIENDQW